MKKGTILITIGAILIIGTAGSSDLNTISIIQIILQSIIGIILCIIGYRLRQHAKHASINNKVLLLYKAQKISMFEEPMVRSQLARCSNERAMRKLTSKIITKRR